METAETALAPGGGTLGPAAGPGLPGPPRARPRPRRQGPAGSRLGRAAGPVPLVTGGRVSPVGRPARSAAMAAAEVPAGNHRRPSALTGMRHLGTDARGLLSFSLTSI